MQGRRRARPKEEEPLGTKLIIGDSRELQIVLGWEMNADYY
jgi:hypothetical protein